MLYLAEEYFIDNKKNVYVVLTLILAVGLLEQVYDGIINSNSTVINKQQEVPKCLFTYAFGPTGVSLGPSLCGMSGQQAYSCRWLMIPD